MPDDSPAHRLRVLKRSVVPCAGLLLVLVVAAAVSGEPELAAVLGLFGAVGHLTIASYQAPRHRARSSRRGD